MKKLHDEWADGATAVQVRIAGAAYTKYIFLDDTRMAWHVAIDHKEEVAVMASTPEEAVDKAVKKLYGKNAFFKLNSDPHLARLWTRFFGQVMKPIPGETSQSTAVTYMVSGEVWLERAGRNRSTTGEGLIAELRQKTGWSQEETANALGVQKAAVSKWELGQRQLRGAAKKLAEQLLAEVKEKS